MTFNELYNEVVANSFPDGLPSNLARQARNALVDALIYAQKYCVAPGKSVGFYQISHMDIHPRCDTYYAGGMTVVPAPNGNVTAVYTNIENAVYCRVDYTEFPNVSSLRKWMEYWGVRHFNRAEKGDAPEPGVGKEYPPGKIFGRAGYGHFTIHNGKIYLAPYIEENEQVVIEWSGLKQQWNDNDVVTIDYDRELVRYAELYMAYDLYSRWYQDTQQAGVLYARMRDAFAELIDSSIDKLQAHQNASKNPRRSSLVQCSIVQPECADVEITGVATDAETKTIIGFVGDVQIEAGENAEDELAVESLITGWNPHAVILGGDIREYGLNYADFFNLMSGYKALMNPSNLRQNRLWPVLGNHDVEDNGGITEWYEYFNWLPNNRRYYEFMVGPVHFFILSSYNEPDGITYDSPQAEWLKVMARASNAIWKVAVVHVPPWSSKLNYEQQSVHGVPLRWPYEFYGIDLVLSGHCHQYERIYKNRVTYIVCGTGGEHPFAPFGTPIAGSQFRYNESFGALKLEADCEKLIGYFYSINDPSNPIDTFEVTKP